MPPRSSWKGYLRLSLVSVPVQAFNALLSGGGEIHLHQLHQECNSRIRYKKVCPIHGEVSNDEIVSGYEYAKGQYVVVDPDELDQLRTASDRAINIDTFIRADKLDPMYFDGRNYYLLPDTPVGQKSYIVLQRALEELGLYGVAQVVFSGREQLVLIRPVEKLLLMTMLHYDAQMRKPAAFQDELQEVEISRQELKLAETLIQSSVAHKFDFTKYEDEYTKKLTELIDAKVHGHEVVSPPSVEEETHVINLMDALRKSVERAKGGNGRRVTKPPRKMAASKRHSASVRKRKSS